jgi:hypothetical protein
VCADSRAHFLRILSTILVSDFHIVDRRAE